MVGPSQMEKEKEKKEEGQKMKFKPHIEVFQSISQVNADLIQRILSILNGWFLLNSI